MKNRQAFNGIMIDCAPALACYHSRFLTNNRNMTNSTRMAAGAARYRTKGVINTIWWPQRYTQSVMYYPIAFSAELVRAKGSLDLNLFIKRFAKKTFGITPDAALTAFLSGFPDLDIPFSVVRKLGKKDYHIDTDEKQAVRLAHTAAERVLSRAHNIRPVKNSHILDAMILAARTVRTCCEGLLMANGKYGDVQKRNYAAALRALKKDLSQDWDATRHADDPQKKRARFSDAKSDYALLLVRNLPVFA